MVTKKKGAQQSDFSAYLGPSVLGVIQHGTIYRENRAAVLHRPEMVKAAQRFPMLPELIVPGSELAVARKQIKQSGTLLYVKYQQMLAGIKEAYNV